MNVCGLIIFEVQRNRETDAFHSQKIFLPHNDATHFLSSHRSLAMLMKWSEKYMQKFVIYYEILFECTVGEF